MSAGLPFLVCSWEADFMECLLEQALADSGGDISSAVFIFPHSRPEKYLSRLLRQDSRVKRPLLAPRCLTVSGLVSAFSARICSYSAWNAGLLDRVGLLLECARQEWGEDRIFAPLLSDARYFFSWGERLASLFEECLVQRRKPENFQNMGGQVSPFAEALLARLAQIFERYVAGLAEREWTTPGLDASLAADWLLEKGDLPPGLISGNAVYIAGFHALSGSEDALLRHLWERRKARIMIHADPALVAASGKNASEKRGESGNSQVHWSCQAFLDWAARWKATLEPAQAGESGGPPWAAQAAESGGSTRAAQTEGRERRSIRYYEGFDLHSQLTVLERELADLAESADNEAHRPERTSASRPEEEGGQGGAGEAPGSDQGGRGEAPGSDQAADTLVVLPDSGLLMPALHHLPRANINISMGYPLSRSPLFRLLDTLARLQEGRRGEGHYWRDVADLIRHPYIKMLRPAEEAADSPPPGKAAQKAEDDATDGESRSRDLRRELYRLEQAMHEQGRKYVNPRELLEQAYTMLGPEEMPPRPVLALLDDLLEVCLDNFARLGDLRELGQALEKVCSLLLSRGGPLWQRFLIDAECLYRLMQSIIPELSRSELSGEPFPLATLFAMLRRLMEAERVPFEAVPLVGLQVMGMLETRLLSFRRVVILDAVEDRLPGVFSIDPLLPEALRQELGLPPLHAREQVAAYHFFRLINGASEVVLLWQEGADSQGIQEGKKKKSRFIEELLWEEEKKLKRLLKPKERGKDGPLTVLASAVAPVRQKRRGVTVSPGVGALVRSLLARPLSASLLDGYLRCPAQFFYQRMVRLNPVEEINEGEDPAAVGDLFHHVLHEGYRPYAGGDPLPGGEALVATLEEELTESLYTSPAFGALGRSLPADSFAMLGSAGKERLARYLEQQPSSAVLALESSLSASFACNDLVFALTGKADRIDSRHFQADPAQTGTAGATDKAGGMDMSQEKSVPGIVILDYKTGSLPHMTPGIWDDRTMWRRMLNWRPGSGGEPEDAMLLRDLAGMMSSVQLPLYLLLYSLCPESSLPAGAMGRNGKRLPALDAAWVDLGRSGAEHPLFPRNFSYDRRIRAVEQDIPELLYFILRHMLESPAFLPHPGQHCDWCSCAKVCMVTDAGCIATKDLPPLETTFPL